MQLALTLSLYMLHPLPPSTASGLEPSTADIPYIVHDLSYCDFSAWMAPGEFVFIWTGVRAI
jgi:hypothetical protein